MAYSVGVERRAQKQIAPRPSTVMRDRVEAALRALADDPRPRGTRELQGREGRRLRVGDYRVVYEVDDAQRAVTVLQVAPRGDVYRRG